MAHECLVSCTKLGIISMDYGQGLPLDVVKDIRLYRCNFKHAIDQGSLHTIFVSTNYIHMLYWIKYSALMGLKVIAKDP